MVGSHNMGSLVMDRGCNMVNWCFMVDGGSDVVRCFMVDWGSHVMSNLSMVKNWSVESMVSRLNVAGSLVVNRSFMMHWGCNVM